MKHTLEYYPFIRKELKRTMKTDTPARGSGKTRFNRGKPKGASWTDLRQKAVKDNTFTMPVIKEKA